MTPQVGKVLWLYGLSGSGKTTLCNSVAATLRARSMKVQILDADLLREGLCQDLGFSLEDRAENIRRTSHVAALLATNGVTVLVAAITPLEAMRRQIRTTVPDLVEIFVSAPLTVCESRDPKGLYQKARQGLVEHFTGIDSPFDVPITPCLICHTDRESVHESTTKIVEHLQGSPTVKRSSLRRPTIAVDFDGVIANYDGWKGYGVLGTPRQDVLEGLAKLRSEGWKIVVHTTRGACEIEAYLTSCRVPFDEINYNSDYNNYGAKPVATVYWDDRALRYTGSAAADVQDILQFRTWNRR